MTKPKIEIIGTHNCISYQYDIPKIVQDFCSETGGEADSDRLRASVSKLASRLRLIRGD